VFAQQSLQPKLSRRRYASVSYALQNNTVFRCAQNWVIVSNGSRTDNGVNSRVLDLDQKQQNIFGRMFVLERVTARSPEQLNGGNVVEV